WASHIRRRIGYRPRIRNDLATARVDLSQHREPPVQELGTTMLLPLDDPALDEDPMLELRLPIIGGISQRILAAFMPRQEADVPPRPLMPGHRAGHERHESVVLLLCDTGRQTEQKSGGDEARAALHQSTLMKLIRSCFS